jgi:DivIVA domain-containing protein
LRPPRERPAQRTGYRPGQVLQLDWIVPGRAHRHTARVAEREPNRGQHAGGGPGEIRDISFHTAVRGYDRREVDRYVQRVNRLIAELEITRSSESAVRHALDRVGEQTSGLLHRARETADEIVNTARSESEETTARGKAEASEIISDARAEADRIIAEAEEEAHDRLEHGERLREALRKQGEETRAEAEATLARARSEASEIVAEAKRETEEIVARADSQMVQHRAREERRLEEHRRQAEDERRIVRADTDGVEEERRRLFEEIHQLAGRLEELVDSHREGVEPEPAAVGAADSAPGAHIGAAMAADAEPVTAGDSETSPAGDPQTPVEQEPRKDAPS